jgi:N-acyl homoserine lactone hydrolase
MLLHGFTIQTNQGSPGFCGVTLVRGSKLTLVDAAHVGRRSLLLDALKARGLRPEDVDQVFLTHAHWDHSLNIDLFPNAEILIHPVEREYCKAPKESDWATPKWTTLMLESQKLREVQEGEEIDDGVSVLATPGHSKGSMAALVRTDNATIAIPGDALPSGWSAVSGLPRLIFWDEQEARTSIRKLLDRADTFYPGHDGPFQVKDGNVRHLEPRDLKFFGWPDPGKDTGLEGIPLSPTPMQATVVG